MRGHEDLIRVRQKGLKPAGLVFVDDYDVLPDVLRWLENESAPNVSTDGDLISSLDLRFLIGLKVSVDGRDPMRVKALAAACRKAGAEYVIATCGDRVAFWKTGDKKWSF